MPATRLDLQGISVQVTEVTDVVATEPELDGEGYWSRDIHVFGEPEISGGSLPIVATFRLRALQKDLIEITAPEQEF